MRTNIIMLFATLFCGVQFGVAQIVLDGNYQGKNLYIQNGFSDNDEFCIDSLSVNEHKFDGKELRLVFELKLDSLGYKIGDSLSIRIHHKNDCFPKVLNSDVCHFSKKIRAEMSIKSDKAIISLEVSNLNFRLSDSIRLYKGDELIQHFSYDQPFEIIVNESDSLIFFQDNCLDYQLNPTTFYKYQKLCSSNRIISLEKITGSQFILNNFQRTTYCSNFPIPSTIYPNEDSIDINGNFHYPAKDFGICHSKIVDINAPNIALLNGYQFFETIEDILIGYKQCDRLEYGSYELGFTFDTYKTNDTQFTKCYTDTLLVERYGGEFQLRDAHHCSSEIIETKKLCKYAFALKKNSGWSIYKSENSKYLSPVKHSLLSYGIDSLYKVPFFTRCFVTKEDGNYSLWIQGKTEFEQFSAEKIVIKNYLTPGIGRPDKNLLLISLNDEHHFIINHYKGYTDDYYHKYEQLKGELLLKSLSQDHYSLNIEPLNTLTFEK